MAQSLRIAQMGQVAVNRPFYEIFMNGRRYAVLVNPDNQFEFAGPSFLKSIGVCSVVADSFQRSQSTELTLALGFVGGRAPYDNTKFPTVNYGSGLSFVADFKPFQGWTGLVPAAMITMTV